jgi:hypothetical protein
MFQDVAVSSDEEETPKPEPVYESQVSTLPLVLRFIFNNPGTQFGGNL